MIEVELRRFLTEEEYERLLRYFDDHDIKEDKQESWYFDTEEDLRILRGEDAAKIWLKRGKMHDEFREEIEIPLKKKDFEKMHNILATIGHKVNIKWQRTRKQCEWDGVKVCIDHTQGYGYILELEKLCKEEDQEVALEELHTRLRKLGIKLTPKEEFDKAYERYANTWQEHFEGFY